MLQAARSSISNWNPQLVRELKGRWKNRNISLAILASFFTQFFIYLNFQNKIPNEYHRTSRYCIGNPPTEELSVSQMYNPPNNYCLEDLVINWQLWWLDLFTWLSVFGIIILLVAGTYILISDLAKEEQTGTLSFVRLSPRSVSNLLIGKILGAPLIIYGVILLGLPLHLLSGIKAEIPVSLILGFYLVVMASCAFFFSAALLYGLVTTGLGTFQSWLGTGIVLFFLFAMSQGGYNNFWINHNPSDWVTLFYPGKILPYLIGETPHSLDTIGYFNLKEAQSLTWYGFPVWNNAYGTIALLVINYSWWTYWVWQGLKRRFHNAQNSLLSKEKSYWFTGSLTVSLIGFMVASDQNLAMNFRVLLTIELLAFLLLIFALSPHRQTLQDWARYRYQKNEKVTRNLITDLMRGEQSPATAAIALNLLSNILIITPAIIFLPLGNDRLSVFATVLLTSSSFLIYACITQLFLLMKTPKRGIFAIVAVGSVMLIPTLIDTILPLPAIISLAFFPIAESLFSTPAVMFFNLLAQWVVITLCSFQLTRQLKQAGQSETKLLA
ncbi:hypothetical protein [Dactylococcopsis salina]|uniref:Uncharacterized protein n=1 Tax=Dactylococcopsis salina (strain PCC 8305) TaxID=13035 RepID=K9YU68_DACS8|nr:hypothetical protein [Dactylococcopsis salina]AFZ50439.1 hypothetical protein Dacsa_1779 [Dactylococcopsis salina PCC 8305]